MFWKPEDTMKDKANLIYYEDLLKLFDRGYYIKIKKYSSLETELHLIQFNVHLTINFFIKL